MMQPAVRNSILQSIQECREDIKDELNRMAAKRLHPTEREQINALLAHMEKVEAMLDKLIAA